MKELLLFLVHFKQALTVSDGDFQDRFNEFHRDQIVVLRKATAEELQLYSALLMYWRDKEEV